MIKPILVVEDDYDIREMFCQILEDEGYPVHAAANGLEALAHLREGGRPGLIFLDLMMPLMSGWELVQHLQAEQEWAVLPVVVISADTGTPHNAAAFNAAGYLSKPLKLAHLLQFAERYCGSSA